MSQPTTEQDVQKKAIDPDHLEKIGAFAEEGGAIDRASLEKKLLLKLDLRFSILIVIYILNVSFFFFQPAFFRSEGNAQGRRGLALGSAADERGGGGMISWGER